MQPEAAPVVGTRLVIDVKQLPRAGELGLDERTGPGTDVAARCTTPSRAARPCAPSNSGSIVVWQT